VAVMRRTPGKAAEWAKGVPDCVGYDSLDAFLQHPGLDAVYVATRPGTHLDLCRAVAAAGKAVYIEKPVGRCAAETAAVVEVCKRAGCPLYTAYISRAYARTQVIRKLLEEGAVGDRITHVRSKLVGTGGARGMNEALPWRLDAAQSGGGLVMDVGCHVLDRIDWLCGPLVQVTGRAEKLGTTMGDVEDFVLVEANIGPSTWASIPSEGAKVSCSWDFSGTGADAEGDELIIEGPKGALKMAGMSPSLPVLVLDANDSVVRTLEFETPQHTAQEMIQAITDELRGVRSEPFISRGDNAIRTSRVLDTALETYYGKREEGYWLSPSSWPGRPS
jgi:1,5-anhydro-D-fructose reductase (1,5-anhydro-D-mannitol-forming)